MLGPLSGESLPRISARRHTNLALRTARTIKQGRIILAGDAAGIDPLFGEGITSALALGTIAAGCAFEALERSDFTFGATRDIFDPVP